MRLATVCSGIGAPELAAESLGWAHVWASEIERLPCAVLAHRFPGLVNLGDMTQIQPKEVLAEHGPIDVFVGGTPCQSFSVAGLRGGLADPRGNLALEFCRLVDGLRPRWFVWENVPGVLSSHGGRDFGAFLGAVGQLGYGWAYRVLDAQYFGVAQRRKRVFVVGCAGGQWQRAAAVLFERESVSGHPAPGRAAGEAVATTVGGGARGGYRNDLETMGAYVAHGEGYGNLQSGGAEVAHPLLSGGNDKCDFTRENYVCTAEGGRGALSASASKEGNNQMPLVVQGGGVHHGDTEGTERTGQDAHTGHLVADTLTASQMNSGGASGGNNPGLVNPVITHTLRGEGFDASEDGTGRGSPDTVCPALRSDVGRTGKGDGAPCVAAAEDCRPTVRRLTPVEWERLQGFPDGWTAVPNPTKLEFQRYLGRVFLELVPWWQLPADLQAAVASDGARYRAIGNSMAVNNIRWLFQRIALVEGVA